MASSVRVRVSPSEEALEIRAFYDITFSTGPTGSKVPLNLDECAIFATPRVEHESTSGEVSVDIDVQRLGGPRIFVESTRPLPFGENKITPFLTNVSFDVAAIC